MVVLIDLDGTIIGDISPQVCEWEILLRFAPTRLKAYKDNLRTQLKQGLMRPDLTNFMDAIKVKYPHTEFFIYTASETRWANVIIPCIENEYGIRFNRPIFNRAHCINVEYNVKKSPLSIVPQITKVLRSKYEVLDKSIANSLLMIDNYNVLVKNEDHILLQCPTYEYTIHYDVLRLIDEETLRENYAEIATILKHYKLFPSHVPTEAQFSYEVFKALYFDYLGSSIKKSIKVNAQPDVFWHTLGDVMLSNKVDGPMNPRLVKYINTKLAKLNK